MHYNERLLSQNIAYLVDEQKRLSRGDLAKAVGVTEASIGQIIRGETKGLRPYNLVMVARAFNIAPEDLVLTDLRNRKHRIAEESVDTASPNADRLRRITNRLAHFDRQSILTDAHLALLEAAVQVVSVPTPKK